MASLNGLIDVMEPMGIETLVHFHQRKPSFVPGAIRQWLPGRAT